MYVAALAASLSLAVAPAHAAIVAQWTFETSLPTTAGPFAPEVGSGAALGNHAGEATVYSNPVGNGSAESFSSNTWAVGDYYQFSTSLTGLGGVTLSWDQTSSSTGPRDFRLAYSTDGTTFTDFASYSVLTNGTPNPSWSSSTPHPEFSFAYDLGTITTLDNATIAYFRLLDSSTVSASGATVAVAGTDRVDNFTISADSLPAAVPVPGALLLMGSGLGLFGVVGRRRRA